MAEITEDIYSLKFDAGSAEQEIQSLIAQVEELEAAMISAQESGEDFGDIQTNLSGTVKKLDGALGKQASTIEGLNQKQQILTKTQAGLTSKGEAYNSVTKANVKVNNDLSGAVVRTTKNNNSLGRSLLSGVRSFNSIRRAGQALGSVFRLIAGISPFGLLLTVGPSVLSFFSKLIFNTKEAKKETTDLTEETKSISEAYGKETAELNNLFGALNEANKGGTDKSTIISEIQSKYGEYIGNINLETASQEELATAYDLAASAIARQVITKQKAIVQEQLISKILEESVKLNLESAKSIDARSAAIEEVNRQIDLAAKVGDTSRLSQLNDELVRLKTAAPEGSKAAKEAARNITAAQQELIDKLAALDASSGAIEEALVNSVDSTKLTGSLDKVGKGVSKTTTDYKALAGSIADLEAQLSNLQKILREQRAVSDDGGLAEIQKQIEAQEKLVEAAKNKLADLAGVAEAEANIERLKTALVEDETNRKIAELRKAAEKEIDAVVGTESQKAEQVFLINEQLFKAINEIRQKSIDDTVKAVEDEKERTIQARQAAAEGELKAIELTEERKLSLRLQILESQRNSALIIAGSEIEDVEKRNQAIEDINKQFDKQRIELENETQRVILQARLSSLETTVTALEKAGETAIEQKAEIEKLRLELIELEKTDPTVEIDAKTDKAKGKVAKFISEVLPLIQEVSDAIFSATAQQFAAVTARMDAAVQRSQTSLDEIRGNSEEFNADQLALEKERLAELTAAREAAAKREQAVALIQVAANSAVAIAKAAAEGGAAAPFTIAATLIALIAGLASARNAASGAFYEGTEYLPLNGAPKGRDTINIRAHEGERIVPTANNLKYFDAYSAMQNENMPASIANLFAKSYAKGGLPAAISDLSNFGGIQLSKDMNIQKEFGGTSFFYNMSNDYSRLERKLDDLTKEIYNLPKRMPVSDFHVNEKGLYMSMRRFVGRMETKANRAK